MHLSLLRKWFESDAEGCVNYWGAERIKNLLELVEDDVFFRVLERMSKIRNNPEVKAILEYYTDDDEPFIRDFANVYS